MGQISDNNRDSSVLGERARAWEEGFKAGLAASRSPSALSIAQTSDSAAEAAGNASELLGEAAVTALRLVGAPRDSSASRDILSRAFQKPPSMFYKPTSIFNKPPSTARLADEINNGSPWTEGL